MDSVEKKKNRPGGPGRIRWILGGVLLLAVCVAVTILVGRETVPVLPEEKPDPRGSIENRETEEISRITIQARGSDKWSAFRNENGKLQMEGQEAWEADPSLSARLEDALANIVYEAVLTEEPESYRDQLADFGLADPELTVTVRYTDETERTLRIGNHSGLEDGDFHYMLIDGDSRLYAVASSYVEDLRIEPELLHPLRQPELQPARADRITVLDADGAKAVEWELQGEITDRDAAESWLLTAPFRYPADYDAITNLKKNIGNLLFGVYIGEAGEVDLAALGLERPVAELRIHLAAGSTGTVTESGVYNVTERPEETFSLRIGNERNEMTRYVQWGTQVCTMNQFVLAPFLEADPIDSAARYPVLLPLESLRRVTAEKNGTRVIYELTWGAENSEEKKDGTQTENRKDPGKENETEEDDRFTVTRNGETMAASAFQAAYDRWMVVTVAGRLPEEWATGDVTEKYVFESLTGKLHTVEMSRFDALHDAVTLDGCTVFYLPRGGMGELP